MALDPVSLGFTAFKIGRILFGSSKKKKAARRQRQANAIRSKASLLRNAIARTQAVKSFRAAVAEGKVGSQAAGGTLRGSATQGQISGSRASLAGSLADARTSEAMGIAANRFDASAAKQLNKGSFVTDLIGGVSQFQGGFSDWWQSRSATPTTTTFAPAPKDI